MGRVTAVGEDTGEGGGIPGVLGGWSNNIAAVPRTPPQVVQQSPAATTTSGGRSNFDVQTPSDPANTPTTAKFMDALGIDPNSQLGKATSWVGNQLPSAQNIADSAGNAIKGKLGGIAATTGLKALGVAPSVISSAMGAIAPASLAYSVGKDFYDGAHGNDDGSIAGWLGGRMFAGTGGNWSGTGMSNGDAKENNPNYSNEGMSAGLNTMGPGAQQAVGQDAAPGPAVSTPVAPQGQDTVTALGPALSGGGGGNGGGGAATGGGPGGGSASGGGDRGTRGGFADGGVVNQDPGLTPYATGGFVDPRMGGGAPGQMAAQGPGLMPQGAPAAPMNPQMLQNKTTNLLAANPAIAQGLQAVVQKVVASGQVSEAQIMQLAQIAQVCLHNPALYPKLVALAVQEGIVPPGALPPQYDEKTVSVLAMVGHGLMHINSQTSMPPGGNDAMNAAPAPQPGSPVPMGTQGPAMASGGIIKGPGTGRSDSIKTQNQTTGQPVAVSNGEYIIPAHVVEVKGKEFFDNLLRKYAHVSGQGQQGA